MPPRGKGHRVFLNTGRSKAEVYLELWDIGVDGLIGANGGYVESDGEVVLHQSLTAEQTRAVVDLLRARGIEFYLEANSGLYASTDFENAAQSAVRIYGERKSTGFNLTVCDAFPDMIYGADPYRADINKISYLLGDISDVEVFREAFPELVHNTWGGRGSTALFGDVGVTGVAKDVAVQTLLDHLGAQRCDTIAMGDAMIDAPMLSFCEVGVDMGNAPYELKEMADLVVADVAHDGLAEAFRRLELV